MKRCKRIIHIFLSLCLFLAMTLPVSAKEEEYTYTIRFFAGKQGSFATGEVVEFSGLHYGARINFYHNAVTLNDNSKYYVRGIRESGKDNSDSSQANSFVVTGDMDYVVAYGIQGETVAYTVTYQDTEGNELYPSAVYYGNVGDMPVVAYQYIEGWQPQAYNLGKTLVADASQNVFSFIYTPIPTVVNTNTVVVPGQPTSPQEPEVAPAQPGPVTVVEPEAEEQEPEVVEVDDEVPPLAEPEEYEDLDEEDTPLGGFNGEGGEGDGDGGPGDDSGWVHPGRPSHAAGHAPYTGEGRHAGSAGGPGGRRHLADCDGPQEREEAR